MPLTPTTRLGPYEILGQLGAGGMGEVYRARDKKLDREVAIKVLPAAVAQDRERLARFEREAKVLASLNRPNIAQIYGLVEVLAGGRRKKGNRLLSPYRWRGQKGEMDQDHRHALRKAGQTPIPPEKSFNPLWNGRKGWLGGTLFS